MSQVSDVGQTHSSPNIYVKNQELLYRHRKGTRASSLLSLALCEGSTLNPFGSASSCARLSGLESGDPS